MDNMDNMDIMEYTEPAKRRRSQEETFEEEQPRILKVKPIGIIGTWRRKKATRVAKGMPTTLTDRLRVRKANIPMDQLKDLLAADTGITVAPDNLYQLFLPSASLSKRVRKGVLLKRPSGQEPVLVPKSILLRKRSFDEGDGEDDADSWESSRKRKCVKPALFDDLPPPKPILKRKHSYDGDDEEDHANAWESSRKRKCTKSVTFDVCPATILGKKRARSSKEEDMEQHPIGEKRACIRDDSGSVSDAIKKRKMMLVVIPLAKRIKHPKKSASNLAKTSQESGPKSVPSGPSSACNVPSPAPSLPLASAAEGTKPGGFKIHNDEAVQLQQATPARGFKLPEGCRLPEVSIENGALPNGIPHSQATTTLLRIFQDHNYLGAEGASNQQQSFAGGEMQQAEGAEGKISAGGAMEDIDIYRINFSKLSISEGGEAGKVLDYKMSIFGRAEANRTDGNIPIFADKDVSPTVERDAQAAVFKTSISAKVNQTLEDDCKISIPISVGGGEAGNCKIPITVAGEEAGNCKIPISAVEETQTVGCKMPISALTDMLKSKLSLGPKLKQQARADRITENPFPRHLRNERKGRRHLQKYLFVSHCVRIIA